MRQSLTIFKPSPIFEWNWQCTKNIIVNQGGTSSGKTYSILQVLILKALSEPNLIITVAGQDIPNLKAGAMRDIERIFDTTPFFKKQIDSHNRTDKQYKFKNSSLIEFKSYDNAQDAKNGKRDYLFVNEANGVAYDIFEELQVRTTRQTYIDYNPTAPFWAHSKLIGRDDVQLFISNFTHNPFLDNNIKSKILKYKETDPERWRVYGLGKTGSVQGAIFTNIIWVSMLPEGLKKVSYGLDFGFTNDPTALVVQGELNGERWAKLLIYETGLTNQDIAQKLSLLQIKRIDTIFADSAEAKSIEELKRLGFNVKPAPKGRDSVLWGIDKIKEIPLRIVQNEDFKHEALNYQWTKVGESWINKPVDRNNHAWDALRYAIAGNEKRGSMVAFGST